MRPADPAAPPRRVPAGLLPALVAGVLGALAFGARLLLPVPVGMANNGDAARTFCHLGADSGGLPANTGQWFYVRFFYPALPPNTPCVPYRTSELLQLDATSWVHRLLGLPGVLDLRELIVEDSVLAGLAFGALAWLLRDARLWARLAVLAAAFVVLADATFADYAASPFGETAALIGLVVVALAGVSLVGGTRRRTAFLLVVLGAALAIGSKTETVSLALPIGLFLAWQKLPWGRLRGRFGARVLPALGVAAVLASAVWVTGAEIDNLRLINVGNELTETLMPESADPATVAADFGLPRSFAKYSGTEWWSDHPIEADPLWPTYVDRFTRANLVHYLATHPAGTANMVTGGAKFYLQFRVDYLGTYGNDVGAAPRAQECRLCLLPTVSRALSWTGFAGVAGYWLLALVGAGFLIRRSRPGTYRRGFAAVTVLLIGTAVVQYGTAVVGDGHEVTKHLVVGLFAAALAPVWLLAGALSGRRPDEPEDEAPEVAEPARQDALR